MQRIINKRRARRKFPPIVCPKKCGHGTLDKQEQVSPAEVGMSETDVANARLHDGEIFRCRHCGLVWEKYRDRYGTLAQRKIGEYDGPNTRVRGFIPYYRPRRTPPH